MSVINAQVFEVNKKHLLETHFRDIKIDTTLATDEVVLKIDKFALTANNISYAIAGDTLGYWQFFPSEQSWGRLPVMGFAEVVASNNDQVNIGERVWGFMPMATHVKITAGKVTKGGFSDISPHREGLSPIYAPFERVESNPFYKVENEDFEMLVRGLFTTSWLIDDFMFDNNYFGATEYLITSASSKTSIALAFAIKERGELLAVGITSESNRDFVEALGCYDKVISYDEITQLDANTPSVLVDMAGSKTTLTAIHNHFMEQLKYSCRVGVTHHSDLIANELSTDLNLPGAKPTFFFAPTQLKKRTVDWGTNESMTKINASLLRFITFFRSIITINHTTESADINKVYQKTLMGKADAAIGQVLSL